MNARLEKIENSEAYLELEVDAESLEEGLASAFRKVSKQVNIPGFRKGRAPRELVERYYGKEILYEDALQEVIPKAYEEAVADLQIDVVGQPDFDIEEVEAGKGVTVKVKVAVKPEVTLGQLEGIEVKAPSYGVTPQEVDRQIEEMLERYSEVVEKADEAAAIGDTVTIDFEGFIDGQAFDGGKGSDYKLELGSNSFIPGFEDQIAGKMAGEEFDVNVSFPEEYHAAELAGQPAVFKVKLHKVQAQKKRELNDEFVQEITEFDNIEAWRADIEKNLLEMRSEQRDSFIREEVIGKAAEGSEMTVPPVMIDLQVEKMIKQFADRMAMQGFNMELYFNVTGTSVDALAEQMRPEAEKQVRMGLTLEAIAAEKSFDASEEEVDGYLGDLAASMNMSLDEIKANVPDIMARAEDDLKVRKAADYLVDNAIISEMKPESEAEAEAEAISGEEA